MTQEENQEKINNLLFNRVVNLSNALKRNGFDSQYSSFLKPNQDGTFSFTFDMEIKP